MADTAELMRTCAPLYPSFAIESLASLILFFFFAYLSILISSKQQLTTPARSICKFVWYNVEDWASDTYRVLSRWPRMHEMDMGQRFRYCRRLNATICRFSATFALISITRWLHVNNVNGMRYLSYAITCPLMQVELVLLIAPIVPCYRIIVMCTGFITACMLISGYTASQFAGDLWETDLHDIIVDGNFHNLTTKGYLVCPSVVILTFLSCVQIPMLCLLYYLNGGSSSGKLPEGYPKLLLITSLTWWGFPIWWMLSYEGMSVITDTRANGVGFVCLNMISKGGYTLQMISMVKTWKRKQAEQVSMETRMDRSNSIRSSISLPELPGMETKAPSKPSDQASGDGVERKERVLPTGQSLNWFVEHMKQFEQGGQGEPQKPKPLEPKDVEKGARVVVRDASELSNDELMEELSRRLSSGGGSWGAHGARKSDLDSEKSLEMQIKLACSQFVIAEDSEEEDD